MRKIKKDELGPDEEGRPKPILKTTSLGLFTPSDFPRPSGQHDLGPGRGGDSTISRVYKGLSKDKHVQILSIPSTGRPRH